ncbi:MAG: molybdate ABC transporter substrate-binding protein [Dehalococcoidia bacterium]|nr:molybdate ABC transporter substrate-binding protein [Dehalococcoidia bacterium]
MKGVLFFLLVLLVAATSCGSDEEDEIVVFTAASLTEVMEQLGLYFTESEGIKVRFNPGGSTSLAQKIIRGAPADAFVFAGPQPMAMLDERGLIVTDSTLELLVNELVLVARSSTADEIEVSSIEEMGDAGLRVAIADPDLAPAGRYARESLQNLGLWQRLEHGLVFGLDVRVTLGYVETGNVDAAIVYRTDAQIVEGLEVLASIPKGSHSPIVYPAGAVVRSSRVEEVGEFLRFLQGDKAKETFQEYGFIPHNGD